MTKHHLYIGLALGALLFCGACDDGDDDNNGDATKTGNNGTENSKIVKLDKWIGSPCTCEGDGCTTGIIPMPYPKEGKGTIKGCENIDMTGIEGGVIACLKTISDDQASIAPPTYFPKGYCAISAVSASNSTVCTMGACYGEPEKMTKCPAGSTMIASDFEYTIAGMFDGIITDKVCAKTCNSDEDCNKDGEMSCITKNNHKFCYHEKNFAFLGDNITYTDF